MRPTLDNVVEMNSGTSTYVGCHGDQKKLLSSRKRDEETKVLRTCETH